MRPLPNRLRNPNESMYEAGVTGAGREDLVIPLSIRLAPTARSWVTTSYRA